MPKLKNFTFYIFILIFAFFILHFNNKASAQEASLSISPPLTELYVKPDKSLVLSYKLQNLSDPLYLSCRILGFSPSGIKGQFLIKDKFEGPVQFKLNNEDIKFNQPFFLNSQETKDFFLQIRLSEGTPEQDYYYVFLFEGKTASNIESGVSSLNKVSVAAPIIITASKTGQLENYGKIADFNIVNGFSLNIFGRKIKLIDSFAPILPRLILANQGKNFIKPTGVMQLKNHFGRVLTYQIIPQNILANSKRLVQFAGQSDINCRQKELCSKASSVLSGFFIGRYQLKTTLNFGRNTPPLSAETVLYALPIKLIAVFLFLSVILLSSSLKKKK